MPVYMKIADIKGAVEVNRTEATMVATELLGPGGGSQPIGLLLPAVQKVREAASRSPRMGPGSIQATPPQPPVLIGLLLPAVQKVREAAGSQSRPNGITSGGAPQPIGLLLPAVQKVREAAARGSGGAVALHLHSTGSAGALKNVQQSKVLDVNLSMPDGSSVNLRNAIVFDVNPSSKGLDVVIGFEKSSQ